MSCFLPVDFCCQCCRKTLKNCFFIVFVGLGELYSELWRACAGPLVEIPRIGERVYYFPQGHIEQVIVLNFDSILVDFVQFCKIC